MNILFLTNKVPYPPKDGGSIATFGMIDSLQEAGHKVTVLAMNTRKHHITPFDIPSDIQAKITFHLAEVPALIRPDELVLNLLFSKLPYNAVRFINEHYRKKLIALLQVQPFDVIQLEGLYLCPYVSSIRKHSKAQIVYRSHNVEHEIWQRSVENASGIKKMYLNILSKRLKRFEIEHLDNYDKIIPITDRDAIQLNNLGNTKPLKTIPVGFNIEEKAENTDFELNLFFIGALDWLPNQEGLIWFLENCWNKIRNERPKTKLRIAGRNAPKWLIDRFNLPNIEYLGEIDDAKEFICSNGVMIAPLLSGSGMRVKIIEGMFYKKAIVTTPIGAEGINTDTELFKTDNVDKFAKHCLSLLNNKQMVITTGNKAYNYVNKEFNNKYLTQKLVKFYKQEN